MGKLWTYDFVLSQGNGHDDDDGPTEEQCKKFVTKACQGQDKKSHTVPKQKPISKQPGKFIELTKAGHFFRTLIILLYFNWLFQWLIFYNLF